MKRAIYPGTFDPVTYGHLDIVNRGLSIFDEIIIAVAADSQKKTLFTVEERIDMIRRAIGEMPRVSVESFKGLLVRHIEGKNAHAIIRGLREVSVFEYEFQMALMNRKLNKNIETIFLMSNEKYTYLTSSIVKEVAFLGGDVKAFVPPYVRSLLKKRIKG